MKPLFRGLAWFAVLMVVVAGVGVFAKHFIPSPLNTFVGGGFGAFCGIMFAHNIDRIMGLRS